MPCRNSQIDIINASRLAQPETAFRHLPRPYRRQPRPARAADETREIYYPPIMKALLEIGCQGHVGQEFIPTRGPMEGLRQAVTPCDG